MITINMIKDAPCTSCFKSPISCICKWVSPQNTRTQFVFLQFPRERKNRIGTGRMAHLGLTNSFLKVGLEFENDPFIRGLREDSTYQSVVLYPGPKAQLLETQSKHFSDLEQKPLRVYVIDGTWHTAKKLIRYNSWLLDLPQISFNFDQPSQYRFRRQPKLHCLSTIEAAAKVLEFIEPHFSKDDYLRPFLEMVQFQIGFTGKPRKLMRKQKSKFEGHVSIIPE